MSLSNRHRCLKRARDVESQQRKKPILKLRLLFIAAVTVIVTACMAIPLTTAIRLSSIGNQSLVALDPQQVRTRVAVPFGFALDVEQTQLSVDVSRVAGKWENHEYRLQLLSKTNGVHSGGLFHPNYPVVVYELALDSASVKDLRELQKVFQLGKDPGLNVSVNVNLASMPDNAESVRFWVDLKLRESDAFMVLFDGAEIQLKKRSGS
jgi:hypothetical protein